MAITETKIVQVENKPEIINNSNEEWGKFGWSVLSVQITHSQDTKTYTKGLDYYTGDKTVETTTINYATITYQRDKSMPCYAQIVQLEQQYMELYRELEACYQAKYSKSDIKFGMSGVIITIALLILFWPGAVVYLVYKYKKKKSATAAMQAVGNEQNIDAKIAKLDVQIEEIAEEANRLMLSTAI